MNKHSTFFAQPDFLVSLLTICSWPSWKWFIENVTSFFGICVRRAASIMSKISVKHRETSQFHSRSNTTVSADIGSHFAGWKSHQRHRHITAVTTRRLKIYISRVKEGGKKSTWEHFNSEHVLTDVTLQIYPTLSGPCLQTPLSPAHFCSCWF